MSLPAGPEWGAKYTLEGPDGTKAVFNDSTSVDFVGILSPESSGLDSADVRESAVDAAENDGGTHGNFYYGRRPVVLQGTIIASSAEDRNKKAVKLQAASNAMRADAILRWKPAGGEEVELKLRRQQPVRITKGYVKDFQIPLVAANPIITTYGSIEVGTEGKSVTKESTEWRDEAGSGGSKVWTNPNNAGKSDNIYATVAIAATGSGEPSKSHWIISKNMGFTIPTKATILNWGTAIERHASEAAQSFKGTAKHTSKTGVITGTGGIWLETIGTSDTALENIGNFGADGLTPEIANAAAFGAGIWIENNNTNERTYSLDQMTISITYIEAFIEIENKGTATTFPTLRLKGPISGPIKIMNVDGINNDYLTLNLSLTSAETLEINLQNHTIKVNGANKYSKLIFTESTWWGLIPGKNKITFSTEGASVLTSFIVEYKHGWV